MAEVETKLKLAQALIKSKEWQAARIVLEPIRDNPTAAKWLTMLDALAPEKEVVPVAQVDTSILEAHRITAPETSQTTGQLVCPKCGQQDLYEVVPTHPANLRCPRCHADFRLEVYQIRAKRSRGNKRAAKRFYSVRVRDASDREQLIEFTNGYYEPEIELRSKDLVGFTYYKGELTIVQNFTIGVYAKLKNPDCFLATYLYGPDSRQVAVLREFRDAVLLRSALLRPLVGMYYWASPRAIRYFGESRLFKVAVRLVVEPIAWAICRGRGRDGGAP